MQAVYRDLISLVRAALHDEVPILSCTDGSGAERLLAECNRHLLVVLAYDALTRAEVQFADELMEKWRIAKEKAIYQAVAMESERSAVYELLEQSDIPYLPLKGSVLKALYPRFGMRQMVDTDLLISADRRELVRELMVERGYQPVRFGAGHHDVYEKKPACCFEMHSSFFDESEAPLFYKWFERLELQAECKGECTLSDEDFYLYFLAHLYNHDQQSGIGLRALVDCYLFLKKKGNSLNRNALLAALKELNLDVFEQEIRCLAFKLFDVNPMELAEREEALLDSFCRSGAIGTIDIMVKRNVERLKKEQKMSKWAYCKSRLVLPRGWFQDHIPFYDRHRWLIPVYYVYRFFRAIIFRRKRLKAELRALKKESD